MWASPAFEWDWIYICVQDNTDMLVILVLIWAGLAALLKISSAAVYGSIHVSMLRLGTPQASFGRADRCSRVCT